MLELDDPEACAVTEVALPAVFTVARFLPFLGGRATLTVDRGVITLGPATNMGLSPRGKVIRHTGQVVEIVTARLFIPWINTMLVLVDDAGVGLAVTYWGGAARWLGPLEAAGFEVHRRTACFPPFAAGFRTW